MNAKQCINAEYMGEPSKFFTTIFFAHIIKMAAPNGPLVFPVNRKNPELIVPARPTPREIKKLSDLDDQEGLRFHCAVAHFYAHDPSMEGRDPVKVIREALAEALVHYYPFAGRLREGPGRKLSVDCTGEGVLFVEADADVELKQLGYPPEPPFPCFDELLYRFPGSAEVLDGPLFLFQVTRLSCKGFIVALHWNHTTADGFGLSQFLNAIGDIARGATTPSVSAVWKREIFHAREPPQVTCAHPEYDKNTGPISPFKNDKDIIERSFFFGSSEVSAIEKFVPNRLSQSTKFELLAAFLWRCRIKALELDPEEEVRLHFPVNSRTKFINPPVPKGYYGNGFALPVAVTTAGELSENPFEYALELVRNTKANVTRKYMQSTTDVLVSKGRPYWSMANSCIVSDTSQLGLHKVDFGWGKPCFAGAPRTEQGLFSFHMKFKNKMGEDGRLVTVGLPAPAMNEFVKELHKMSVPNLLMPLKSLRI